MAGGLKRDLGLFPVMAISIGAMVGSGIFILPALAYKIAGPTIVLAFLLAGVLVLPAALSKIEMAIASTRSTAAETDATENITPASPTSVAPPRWNPPAPRPRSRRRSTARVVPPGTPRVASRVS